MGDRLHCVFVDNGLLRKGERESVAAEFGDFDLRVVDARARFLAALMDVTDPFDVFAQPERLEHHLEALTEFALRGLGCSEATLLQALAKRQRRRAFDDVVDADGSPYERVSVYDVLEEAGITVKHKPSDES